MDSARCKMDVVFCKSMQLIVVWSLAGSWVQGGQTDELAINVVPLLHFLAAWWRRRRMILMMMRGRKGTRRFSLNGVQFQIHGFPYYIACFYQFHIEI